MKKSNEFRNLDIPSYSPPRGTTRQQKDIRKDISDFQPTDKNLSLRKETTNEAFRYNHHRRRTGWHDGYHFQLFLRTEDLAPREK